MLSALKPMIPVIWHTITIYLFLVVMFRLVGRRQLGQLNAIDLVIIIVMGSAVETSMVAGNTSLAAGLVCASTLLFVNRLIAFLMLRSRRWRHIVAGNPILLIKDGHFLEEHLRRAGMTQEDVIEALREREEARVEDVKFAVLELDGGITVIPRGAEIHRTTKSIHEKASPPENAPAQ
jgi:uncharacterized membrane protein YcaP (DUF421 family)